MSSVTSKAPVLSLNMAALRGYWGWFLVLGIAMVALGVFAISWISVATVTVAATWVFGCLLIGSGVLEILSAFAAARWSGTIVHLLIGVLYTVVGMAIVDQPAASALVLTRVISIFLIVGGVFRILSAFAYRFEGWGWLLLNGVVALALGIMIYRQWPFSALWFIGLCVGIELILNGWTWIMLSLTMRRLKPSL